MRSFLINLFVAICHPVSFCREFFGTIGKLLRMTWFIWYYLRNGCTQVTPVAGFATFLDVTGGLTKTLLGLSCTCVIPLVFRKKVVVVTGQDYHRFNNRQLYALCLHEIGHVTLPNGLDKKVQLKIQLRQPLSKDEVRRYIRQEIIADSNAISQGYGEELAQVLESYLPVLADLGDRLILGHRIAICRGLSDPNLDPLEVLQAAYKAAAEQQQQ